ncbi:MAG: TlpA family protein disulfide reductase [Gammaproteobacteria bacterium]|nr:TlpA family protein disulfide reductase [Gammaproteobacteria bacterium]
MLNKSFSYITLLIISSVLLIFTSIDAEGESKGLQMTPISYVEWETQRQQYLPNVLVVDMWAMWCVSCIERFPEMVRLHDEYKNQNVQFVSMNLDDREDTLSLKKAEEFLTTMNASFDHYRMNENLLHAFEKIDLIGIPAVLIYDRKGNEQYRLTGDNPNKQFTEKDIEAAVNDLLK